MGHRGEPVSVLKQDEASELWEGGLAPVWTCTQGQETEAGESPGTWCSA